MTSRILDIQTVHASEAAKRRSGLVFPPETGNNRGMPDMEKQYVAVFTRVGISHCDADGER